MVGDAQRLGVRRVDDEHDVLAGAAGTGGYGAPYYGSFYGYWGYGWGAVYDPGYLRTDTVVMVETLIYSVTQDKLVWAGHSKTTNPSIKYSDVFQVIKP